MLLRNENLFRFLRRAGPCVVVALGAAVYWQMAQSNGKAALVQPYESPLAMQPSALNPVSQPSLKLPEHPVAETKSLESDNPQQEVKSLLDEGLLQAQSGNLDAAVGTFEKAVTSEPRNGTALYALVGAYLESGQGERGKKFLQKLANQNDENKAGILTALADLKLTMGDALGAQTDAERAYELDSNSPTTAGILGTVYRRLGDPRAADLLERNPSAENEKNFIEALIESKDWAEAESRISKIGNSELKTQLMQQVENSRNSVVEN